MREETFVDTAAIADVLSSAFIDSEDLLRFIRHRAELGRAREIISERDSKQTVVDKVIAWCETRLLWIPLLELASQRRPDLHRRLAPLLHAAEGQVAADLARASALLGDSDASSRQAEGYELTELLGRSLLTSVYRANSTSTGSPVAVKFYHISNPLFTERFERIMASNTRLAGHPHIVEITDCRCQQETGQAFAPYVVMEYLAGPSLRTWLVNRSIPDDTVVKLIGQACDALQFAHDQRIVHGSIRTDNILLTDAGNAKLVDFRIGELGGTLESVLDGRCIPDPKYTSCEQAQGLAPTPQSDQYSLGVVLYELLTGRAPFTGSILEIIDKHKTRTPEAPTAIRASIDRRAEEVALRTLSKDPNGRYASMEEMARALGYNEPFYTGGS